MLIYINKRRASDWHRRREQPACSEDRVAELAI
jgi:hypothetical protein